MSSKYITQCHEFVVLIKNVKAELDIPINKGVFDFYLSKIKKDLMT